jgi:hypothetical protein
MASEVKPRSFHGNGFLIHPKHCPRTRLTPSRRQHRRHSALVSRLGRNQTAIRGPAGLPLPGAPTAIPPGKGAPESLPYQAVALQTGGIRFIAEGGRHRTPASRAGRRRGNHPLFRAVPVRRQLTARAARKRSISVFAPLHGLESRVAVGGQSKTNGVGVFAAAGTLRGRRLTRGSPPSRSPLACPSSATSSPRRARRASS